MCSTGTKKQKTYTMFSINVYWPGLNISINEQIQKPAPYNNCKVIDFMQTIACLQYTA